MNFLKRSFLAVIRRKGRFFLLFFIFAVIVNMVLAGFAIQKATEHASILARQKLGGELTLAFDTQGAIEKAREEGISWRLSTKPVSQEMADVIFEQPNIFERNYIVNASGYAEGFEPVIFEENNAMLQGEYDSRQGMAGRDRVIPDVTISGVSFTDLMPSFRNGDFILIEGRHIETQDEGGNVALIEENLAHLNNLNIGDIITLVAERSDVEEYFTVVGIFRAINIAATQGTGMRSMPFTQPYNLIYADYMSVIPLKTIDKETEVFEGGIDLAVFYIDDPINIERVLEDIDNMPIDMEEYILNANDQAYQKMMGPIENVAAFSASMIYIIIIAGVIILALILMLFIKDRIYETGILLSMGEGKVKIISQYIAEVLIVATLAFFVSSLTGNFIAQGVGNLLLEREISTIHPQTLHVQQAFGGGGGGFRRLMESSYDFRADGNIEVIDTLQISVSSMEILQMILVGLIIIFAGIILPALTVMRYNPKTILTKVT
ncbi:UNVERIFIED_CONTAM: putative ABC transport system permease protein [Acetivibrio alkalicellulosi]